MKHYAYNSPFMMKDEEGHLFKLTVEQDDMAESPREWDNMATLVCWHRRYNLGDKHNYDGSDEFFEDILHNVCGLDYEAFEELSTREKYQLACESDKICIKEINMYEHSGITISTSNGYPYNDRWDAGCVGFAYITKEKAFKEFGGVYVLDENGERIKEEYKHNNAPSTWGYKIEPLTEDNWKARAEECIDAEVDTYDHYLRGDVYGYILEEEITTEHKCPHCNEVISTSTDWVEQDSCWGFYGSCLEENGILDNISGLEFADEEVN